MKSLNLFWTWFCSQMEKSALNTIVDKLYWFLRCRIGYTAANVAAASVLFLSLGLAFFGVVITAAVVAIAASYAVAGLVAVAPFIVNIAVTAVVMFAITRSR